jgi:hypothetical protein
MPLDGRRPQMGIREVALQPLRPMGAAGAACALAAQSDPRLALRSTPATSFKLLEQGGCGFVEVGQGTGHD